MQIYKKELEAEFGPFDDWVNTYDLFRGKANDEDGTNDERFVGKFKVMRSSNVLSGRSSGLQLQICLLI